MNSLLLSAFVFGLACTHTHTHTYCGSLSVYAGNLAALEAKVGTWPFEHGDWKTHSEWPQVRDEEGLEATLLSPTELCVRQSKVTAGHIFEVCVDTRTGDFTKQCEMPP